MLSQLKNMRLAVSENSWTELSVPLFACSKKRNPLSEDLPVRPVVRHKRRKGSGRQAALSGTGSQPAAFPQGFQINYWLTDFKVRSERMAKSVDPLVKDDDAVAELAMSRCGAIWSRVRIQAAGIGPVRGIVPNICGGEISTFRHLRSQVEEFARPNFNSLCKVARIRLLHSTRGSASGWRRSLRLLWV